jgi:HlyD family secretion protein
MERFKDNVEETGGSAELEQMSDEAFDKELQNLMEEENNGKKEEKERLQKKMEQKEKDHNHWSSGHWGLFYCL